jgi:hypothetical protein
MTSFQKLLLSMFAAMGIVTARAELTWDQRSIERVAAYGDATVEIPFTFKNSGDRPVSLLKVDSNCSCMTADLQKKTYQPGETGKIVAIFTIGDRRGLQEKQVRVTTSDDPKEPVVLTLKVQIPAVASLGDAKFIWKRGGALDEKSTGISVQPGAVVTLEPLTAAQAALFSAEVKSDTATGGYTVKVRPLSTAKAVMFPIRLKVVPPTPKATGDEPVKNRTVTRPSTLLCILRID